jgi:hypothetical protein
MDIPLTFVGILYSVVCFILYRTLQSFLLNRHNARRSRELKCQDPPSLPSTLPLGFDILQSALAADRNMEYPVEMERRTAQVGANTYHYSTMGSTNLLTVG